jgi:type I restriction enzyme S subunit
MEGRELPVGWSSMELNDAGIWGSGGTPSRKNPRYYENGTIPWLVIGDLNDQPVEAFSTSITELGLINSSAKLIPTGSLLVAMYGSIGKLGITTFPCTTNQAIAFCIPNEELVELRYLFHALANAKPELIAKGQGGAQQNISQGILKEHLIHLSPLYEQRRIAAKLDTTLAAVEACRQRLDGVAAILKRFRQAVLAAATSGELTREWREDNPIDEDTGDNEVASLIEKWISSQLRGKAKIPAEPDLSYWTTEIPQSWHLGSVSMFAECLDSQRIPVKKDKRNAVRGTYPYYGANGIVDMVDEYIFDGELVLVTEDETFYGREKPIAYRSSGKCWVNNHAHVLRPEDAVAADYLCYCLMHYPVLPWLTGTTGRAKLTQGVLNSLPMAIPPRIEMELIVIKVQELLSLADQLEAKLATARKIVDRLTPALLAKAFRGELVPQDPTDEPASVLLERIRAARKADAGEGKHSRRGRKKAAANPEPGPPPAAPAPPDLLAQLLQERGALSERALLGASELDPGRFRRQLAMEVEAGKIREELEGGKQVSFVVGEE